MNDVLVAAFAALVVSVWIIQAQWVGWLQDLTDDPRRAHGRHTFRASDRAFSPAGRSRY